MFPAISTLLQSPKLPVEGLGCKELKQLKVCILTNSLSMCELSLTLFMQTRCRISTKCSEALRSGSPVAPMDRPEASSTAIGQAFQIRTYITTVNLTCIKPLGSPPKRLWILRHWLSLRTTIFKTRRCA